MAPRIVKADPEVVYESIFVCLREATTPRELYSKIREEFDAQDLRANSEFLLEALICGFAGIIEKNAPRFYANYLDAANPPSHPALHPLSMLGCTDADLPEIISAFNLFCSERPAVRIFLNDAFHTVTLACTEPYLSLTRIGTMIGLLAVPHGALDPHELPLSDARARTTDEYFLHKVVNVDRLRNGEPMPGTQGPPLAYLLRTILSTIQNATGDRESVRRFAQHAKINESFAKFLPEQPTVLTETVTSAEAEAEESSEEEEAEEDGSEGSDGSDGSDAEDAAADAEDAGDVAVMEYFREAGLAWFVTLVREQGRRANTDNCLKDCIELMNSSAVTDHIAALNAKLEEITSQGVVECSTPARTAAFVLKAIIGTLGLNSRVLAQELAKAIRRWAPVLRRVVGWGVPAGATIATLADGTTVSAPTAGPWLGAEAALVVALQTLCYDAPQLLDCFGTALRAFYDNRIVEEEVILAWQRKAQNGALGKGYITFGKQAEELITFLESAPQTRPEIE